MWILILLKKDYILYFRKKYFNPLVSVPGWFYSAQCQPTLDFRKFFEKSTCFSQILIFKKSFTPHSVSLRIGLTVLYFFLVSQNTKLYETGHCFATSFNRFAKLKKYKKCVSSCFVKLKKTFRFVFLHIFIKIFNLLFKCCTFQSSFAFFL